jgi:hypothetical protein
MLHLAQVSFVHTHDILQYPNRTFLMDDDIMPPTWKYNTPGHVVIDAGNASVYFAAPYSGQLREDGVGIGGYDAWRKVNILTAGFDNVGNATSNGDALPSLLRYDSYSLMSLYHP